MQADYCLKPCMQWAYAAADAKAGELAKDAGTSRRSLEGPAAMPGFAQVDSRASPQKAGGPAGSSLGTEVSLKHGLGSGGSQCATAAGSKHAVTAVSEGA